MIVSPARFAQHCRMARLNGADVERYLNGPDLERAQLAPEVIFTYRVERADGSELRYRGFVDIGPRGGRRYNVQSVVYYPLGVVADTGHLPRRSTVMSATTWPGVPVDWKGQYDGRGNVLNTPDPPGITACPNVGRAFGGGWSVLDQWGTVRPERFRTREQAARFAYGLAIAAGAQP